MNGKRMYLAPKSGNYLCFSWSAGETAHSLWSSLTQLRSAVRKMRIRGGSWGMLPSPEFSHIPLFPSHPLQTSLSPTIPTDCQRGAISRLLHEGKWTEDDQSTGTAVLSEQSNSFKGSRSHQQSSKLKWGSWTRGEGVDSWGFRVGGMKNWVSFQGSCQRGDEGGHSPGEAVPQQPSGAVTAIGPTDISRQRQGHELGSRSTQKIWTIIQEQAAQSRPNEPDLS